jgi:hypothetical protein
VVILSGGDRRVGHALPQDAARALDDPHVDNNGDAGVGGDVRAIIGV